MSSTIPGPPPHVTNPVDLRPCDRRAVAPVLGVVLLVALTVVLAAVVGVVALGAAGDAGDAGPTVVSLSVDAGADRLSFVHLAGEPLDVRRLGLRVRVAGMHHQSTSINGKLQQLEDQFRETGEIPGDVAVSGSGAEGDGVPDESGFETPF